MASASNTDHPGVIAFPPLIFVGCAIVAVGLHFLAPIEMPDRRISLAAGSLFAGFAGTLAFWAARVMRAAGTNIRPDKPALTIVRGGPYRFTRNPMYLALCLFQVALGFFLNDWIGLLLAIPLAAILHFGVILREERYLEAKFGEPYLALKREVGRWI